VTPAAHPLAGGAPERWAVEWGEDRFGAFASFAVGRVVQRMRWIPPGRFWMGSPESEAGRFNDEGPMHEVVLTRGYWLGDTPCTQALWEEVMGENPSRFRSASRPVEQVSWQDCQEFLQRLSERVPGLGARLPTEGEWEYGCRAGTSGATWVGELELRGENDAPQLDAIAWYGGNSGVGFELEDGYDSRDWPEKQYPHERAGTHPVGKKKPNPLGLYDMLGNVWEWCEDWYGPYQGAKTKDPRGPRTGSIRVIRGGGWDGRARSVRAARRDADAPGYRIAVLGFRLARGQASSRGAEPKLRSGSLGLGRAAERPEPRDAGRVPGGAPPRDAAAPPDRPQFEVRRARKR
jgi:formylglycine-generating enzyme required for sulfatase activity